MAKRKQPKPSKVPHPDKPEIPDNPDKPEVPEMPDEDSETLPTIPQEEPFERPKEVPPDKII